MASAKPVVVNQISVASRPNSLILLILGSAMLVLASVWAAGWFVLQGLYDDAIVSAARDDSNLTRVIEEHALRTIRGVDQASLFIVKDFERDRTKLDLTLLREEGYNLSKLYTGVGLIDEKGMLLAADRDFRPRNLRDREYIKVHFEHRLTELFIGKPRIGAMSNRWTIPMSRRANNADGSLRGIAVLAVDPLYFSNFYRELDLGKATTITLVGLDGVIRARVAPKGADVGQDVKDSELFRFLPAQAIGNYTAVSKTDGVLRTYTFRRIRDYPLAVVVGSSVEENLVDYRHQQTLYLTALGLFSVGVLVVSAIMLMLLARDLRARRELATAKEAAESANHLKSEFLASMSHELRTPLNGIMGFADLLHEDGISEEHKSYAGVIKNSALHLLNLLNALLDMAKVEAGKMDIQFADEAIEPMVRAVAALHAEVARGKRLAFDINIAPDLPPLACDKTRLTQILNNLLNNAIKFTETGSVELGVTQDLHGGQIVFTVADTGPGIPMSLRAVLFEPFRQGREFITRTHSGTGLGLSLARRLAELQGGTLDYEPREPTGSLFTLRMPLKRSSDAG